MKQSRYLEWAVYAAGSLYVLIFLFAAISRLLYPYEVEWNEGAVLDHAIRILEGKPLYTAPSMDFSPFVYTPIYYFVVAGVMKIGGIGLWAGRAVSILATFLTAWLAGSIVRRETASTFLAVSGALLYLAFYHATGFFFDIVRMDALALLLAVAAIYAAAYMRRGHLLSALLLALAYFTKQQMILFLPAIAVWITMRDRDEGRLGRFKDAIILSAISIALIVFGSILANAATDGWYSYYTFRIPGIKARTLFSWNAALEFIPTSLLGGQFALATAVTIGATGILVLSRRIKTGEPLTLFLLCFASSIVSASMGMGNAGGYRNVLMPLAAMVALLFPVCANIVGNTIGEYLHESVLSARQIACCIILFEFLALAYSPMAQVMLVGSTKQRLAGDEFCAKLRSIPGNVWIPFHGYIGELAGKKTHVHFMAMNDALIPGDTTSVRFQQEIDSAYSSHRFGAIILDEDKVFSGVTGDTQHLPHYRFATTLFHTPNVYLSRIGDAPTRPQFVYLPDR